MTDLNDPRVAAAIVAIARGVAREEIDRLRPDDVYARAVAVDGAAMRATVDLGDGEPIGGVGYAPDLAPVPGERVRVRRRPGDWTIERVELSTDAGAIVTPDGRPRPTVDGANIVGGSVADANAAQAAAEAAQDAADAANAELATIASDGVLAEVEKPAVIRDYGVITTEQAGIDAQATAYGITTAKATYDTAIAALTTYLGTLVSPVAWNVMPGTTTIVGATFRAKFADVYTTRQALLNAVYAAAKVLADAAQGAANAAQVTADAAVTNAATAQSTANTAAANATTALAQLTDIASDSLLTPVEKPPVIATRDVLIAEQAGIDSRATAYGITTEKTAYDNAVSALTTYLATLTTPVLWSTLSGNTTIVGTTFRSKFQRRLHDPAGPSQRHLHGCEGACRWRAVDGQHSGHERRGGAGDSQHGFGQCDQCSQCSDGHRLRFAPDARREARCHPEPGRDHQ